MDNKNEQARQDKKQLNDNLLNQIKEFEKRYDLKIYSIDVESVTFDSGINEIKSIKTEFKI